MKYAEVKNDYLMEIEHIEKLTKTTCITYKSNSNHYEKWLAADGHENADAEFAFSLQTLKKYQMSLSKRGQRPRSIRGKFNPLRRMVTYLIKNGYMEKNPFDLLKQPKKDAAIRLTMTKTEAEAIWEACERHPDPRQVAFWRALMATLLFTGARADEVTKIEVSHINLEDETLLIANGKGQKSRCLSLTTETVVAYKAWIAERAKMQCEHPRLFARGPRQGMSDEKLRTHLEEIKAIAGLRAAPNIKPHTCRHFFASNMLKNGATIKEIQAALGHSSVEQTAIYLHVDEDGAKAIKKYASFNPTGSVDNRSITPGRPEKVKSGRSAQSFQRRRSTAARRMPAKV